MNIKKMTLAFISCVTILASLCSCGQVSAKKTANTKTDSSSVIDNTKDFAGFDTAAEDESLKLMFSGSDKAIKLLVKSTGRVWDSRYIKEGASYNQLWTDMVSSLISVEYSSRSAANLDLQTIPSTNEYAITTVEKIKNGVNFQFYFQDAMIGVGVSFKLENGCLIAEIPHDSIIESGDNIIVNVNVLPFFGASDPDQSGYLFYPNGSGEIYNFKNESDKNIQKAYSGLKVYSTDDFALEHASDEASLYDSNAPVIMPVFGIKNGNDAILGIISDGEKNSSIEVYTSVSTIKTNRINPKFTLRNSYNQKSFGLGASGGEAAPVTSAYDYNVIEDERRVVYKFLSGESADYVGMAKAYRAYLTENKLINTDKENQNYPLTIDILGGIKKPVMFFEAFYSLTTFSQAEKFLNSIKEAGVEKALINYEGWSKTGMGKSPVGISANSKLGGEGGLKSLREMADKIGFKLTLSQNLTVLDKSVGGFSLGNDAVTDANNSQVTNMSQDVFLLNPHKALKASEALINKIEDQNLAGISYEKLGKFLFADYNSKNYITASQAADVYNNILENTPFSRVEGGNAYILKNADMVYSVPLFNNQLIFTDEQIPFYQIAIHGSVAYSTTPVNLFYDYNSQILKLIEYGFIPSFTLSNDRPEVLKDTKFNTIFSSQFSDWEENITELYNIYTKELDFTFNSQITDHKKISEGLYKTSYEGGAVYVNYSQNDITIDGITVEKKSFKAVRGE